MSFKLPAPKPKRISFKSTISSDILLDIKANGTKSLSQWCNRCCDVTPHLRIPKAIQCILCKKTTVHK